MMLKIPLLGYGPTRELSPQATQQKALVEDVAKMVQEELSSNAYVADTDAFLSRVLPVDSTHVDSVLQYLNTFSPSWNSVPSSPTKEKDLYQPFVDTATAVMDACRALGIKLEIDHAYWIARPDDAPRSRDEFAPLIRPAVAMMLGNDDVQSLLDLDNATKVLMDKIVACQSTEEKAKLSKELAEKCSVSWLRVVAPVEMKPNDDLENRKSGVVQLYRHLRQVLREQLDRRFALGLLVYKSKLSVWFCDRSGILGTATPIDIYTDARKFVQVIMAFSCLPPLKLGWDRSMMIYHPKTRTRHFSTDRDISLSDYDSTIPHTQWAILVPEEDSTTGKWYVTVRALSTSRAAAMSDRATLVWAVVEMGQSEASSEQYVLKQAWRMERSTKEADFRAALTSPTPHVCDIIRSVDMGVKDGETDVKDETSSRRQGLWLQPFTDSIFANATEVGNENASELDETKSAEQSVPVIATEERHAFTAQSCTIRVLTRTLMRTYGWSIKFFKDLLELITVIRDAIEGHRDLYFRGVVHRDISTGNILICYQHNCSDPAHNTFGCLIDLEYAKQTEKRIQYSSLDVSEEQIRVFMDFLRLCCNVQMDSSLAVLILRRFNLKPGHAVTYVEKVLQIFPKTHEGLITKDDLHLYEPNAETPPPFWADRQAGVGRPTGTRAFMSYEVLSREKYSGIETRTDCIGTQAFHSAIHDLESFFWVLVYLCLTRKGPGGARRDELCMQDPTDPRTQALHVIVYCLFDSDDDITLTTNKRKLFQQPDDFDTLIMDHFHPYFERLKPLLSRWWKILRLGFYAYDDFVQGTIHQEVLAMLDDEITRISQGSPTEAEKLARDAMEKELARRREELQQNASIARDIHPWEA